jgi:hypothetical protein
MAQGGAKELHNRLAARALTNRSRKNHFNMAVFIGRDGNQQYVLIPSKGPGVSRVKERAQEQRSIPGLSASAAANRDGPPPEEFIAREIAAVMATHRRLGCNSPLSQLEAVITDKIIKMAFHSPYFIKREHEWAAVPPEVCVWFYRWDMYAVDHQLEYGEPIGHAFSRPDVTIHEQEIEYTVRVRNDGWTAWRQCTFPSTGETCMALCIEKAPSASWTINQRGHWQMTQSVEVAGVDGEPQPPPPPPPATARTSGGTGTGGQRCNAT